MTIDEAKESLEAGLDLELPWDLHEALKVAVKCVEAMKDIEADIKKNKTCILVDIEWFNKKYKEG